MEPNKQTSQPASSPQQQGDQPVGLPPNPSPPVPPAATAPTAPVGSTGAGQAPQTLDLGAIPASAGPQPAAPPPVTGAPVQPPVTGPQAASQPQPGTLPVANGVAGNQRPKFDGKSKEASESQRKRVATAQNTLLIAEIRDGMVIMRDGSFRAVIMCQSINFDLMSEQEKEAVEQSYRGFLNSLGFPLQVYIRSRRIDLNKYIEKLTKTNKEQENILLSLLMEDYIAYVQYLIQSSNIMNKQFYIVVPYYPTFETSQGLSSGLKKLTNVLKPSKQVLSIGQAEFERSKTELTQQVQVVLNGLQQMNVQAVPLNTEELIELYYTVYNPQTAINEQLANVADLEAPIVAKGQGQAPQILGGGQE